MTLGDSAPFTSEVDPRFLDDRKIELIKLRKRMCLTLGTTASDSLQVKVSDPVELFGQRLYEASFEILADKLVDDTYAVYFYWDTPASAWQMFKKDYLPRWFVRRYPVRSKHHKNKRTVRFTRYAEYPKANVAIPKNTQVFITHLGNFEAVRDTVIADD